MLRVRQAIKELDYVPNSAARNIRKKESNLVGMLVPKITNDFYSLMASTFMDEADKENIMVMLIGYGYSREREEREEQLRLEVSFPQLGYALAVVDANSGLELACGCAGPLRRARRRQHGQRHGRRQQGG